MKSFFLFLVAQPWQFGACPTLLSLQERTCRKRCRWRTAPAAMSSESAQHASQGPCSPKSSRASLSHRRHMGSPRLPNWALWAIFPRALTGLAELCRAHSGLRIPPPPPCPCSFPLSFHRCQVCIPFQTFPDSCHRSQALPPSVSYASNSFSRCFQRALSIHSPGTLPLGGLAQHSSPCSLGPRASLAWFLLRWFWGSLLCIWNFSPK